MEASEVGEQFGTILRYLIPLAIGFYFGYKKFKGGNKKDELKRDN